MNEFNAIGRLTKDPEMGETKVKKVKVAKFTLAVPRYPKKEGQPEADFIRTIVHGKPAENCEKYIGQGSLVSVTGSIHTRTYKTDNDETRYITELIAKQIEFLDFSHKNKTKEQAEEDDVPEGMQEIDDPLPY